MKKIFCLSFIIAALFANCKKPELAGDDVTGEGLVGFTLLTPSSGVNLVLNSALTDSTIDITWNASKPGLYTAPTYKWVAALKTGGDLTSPLLSIPSNNSGKDTKLTLTYKQIDDALAAKSIAAGAKTDLVWSVVASNGSTDLMASNQFFISFTRFQDGASPFVLLGPASSAANIEINPSSTTDNFTFNWTKSKPAKTASGLKYRVWFYTDDNSATPVFSAPSNNSGNDSLLTISWKSFSDSLSAHGYTDFSTIAQLKWKVAATSGTWTQWSDYTNQFHVVRLVRMYIVGKMTGWDINSPVEIVADKANGRLGKVFYTYMKLEIGDEFKFVKEPGNWGSAYGAVSGSAGSYTTGYNQGDNFKITTAGIYRLTIDLGANMAYIQQKQVGVVGNMQGWDPGNPIYGGLLATNKFLIIAGSSGSDEFKLHDGPVWDNSTPDKARWWGIGSSVGLLDVDGNGANLVANSTPRTRVIWNGTDPQQLKYEISAANEMRVVGDGISGVNAWDPGTSPQMTYMGNGKWQITLTLLAGKQIKFLAGNAWGAFDYEDAGGGKIRYDGSDNFNTPGAGSYTIVLDEYAGTITMTP
ncbi:MAG: SusE domain-containing protein [Chitinophagaceae bacterium]